MSVEERKSSVTALSHAHIAQCIVMVSIGKGMLRSDQLK